MKYKNLNEEINRMKSLMGEERLYGNLVDVTNKVLSENRMLLQEQTVWKSLLKSLAKGDPAIINRAINTLKRVDNTEETLSLVKQLEDYAATNPNKPLTDDLIRSLDDRIEILSQKGDLDFNTIARNIVNLDDSVYRNLVDKLSPEEIALLVTSFRKDVNDLFDKYNKWVDENITAKGFNIETVNNKIKNNVDILINQKWVKEFPGSEALLRRQVQDQLDNLLETNIQKHNEHVGYTKKGDITDEPTINLKSIDDTLKTELEMAYARVFDDFLENEPDSLLTADGKLIAGPKQIEKMEEEALDQAIKSGWLDTFIKKAGQNKVFAWFKKAFKEFLRLLIIPSDTLVKWASNTVYTSLKIVKGIPVVGGSIPKNMFDHIKNLNDFMNLPLKFKKVQGKGLDKLSNINYKRIGRVVVMGINTFIGQLFFITDFQRFINKSWNSTFGKLNSDWVVGVDPLESPEEGPGAWVPIFGNVAGYLIDYVSDRLKYKTIEGGCTLWREFLQQTGNDKKIKRCTPMIKYLKSGTFKENIQNKLLLADCETIKFLYDENTDEEERVNRQMAFIFDSDPEIKKSVTAIQNAKDKYNSITGQNIGENSTDKVLSLLSLLADEDDKIQTSVGGAFNISQDNEKLKAKIKKCGGDATSTTPTTTSDDSGKKVYGGSEHDIPQEVIDKSEDKTKTEQLNTELGDTTKKIVFKDPSQG